MSERAFWLITVLWIGAVSMIDLVSAGSQRTLLVIVLLAGMAALWSLRRRAERRLR